MICRKCSVQVHGLLEAYDKRFSDKCSGYFLVKDCNGSLEIGLLSDFDHMRVNNAKVSASFICIIDLIMLFSEQPTRRPHILPLPGCKCNTAVFSIHCMFVCAMQVLLAFCDACNLESHPGWSLRNLLALAAHHW